MQRTTKETDAGSVCLVVTGPCLSSSINDALMPWLNPHVSLWMPLNVACKQRASTARRVVTQILSHQLYLRLESVYPPSVNAHFSNSSSTSSSYYTISFSGLFSISNRAQSQGLGRPPMFRELFQHLSNDNT